MARILDLKVYDKVIYRGQNNEAILLEGDYEERHFIIVRTRMGHPCAYVETKPDDWAYSQKPGEWSEQYDVYDVYVHGGATYYGKLSWDHNNRIYLGWDYAHMGDYDYCFNEGYKWTLPEILMDIARAVDGIDRQNGDHWEETHALPIERDGT